MNIMKNILIMLISLVLVSGCVAEVSDTDSTGIQDVDANTSDVDNTSESNDDDANHASDDDEDSDDDSDDDSDN